MRSRKKILQKIGVVVVGITAATLIYIWQGTPNAEAPGTVYHETAEDWTDDLDSDELRTIEEQIPVRMKIAAINVNARIVPVGKEPDGAMAAPQSASDIGWYEKSAVLGSTRRAMLMNGHYGLESPEVFHRLVELEVGDEIIVEGEKGDEVIFRVSETERKHRFDVDMEKAFNYALGQESLSIITCIGKYDYSAQTYDDRYIVYGLRVK